MIACGRPHVTLIVLFTFFLFTCKSFVTIVVNKSDTFLVNEKNKSKKDWALLDLNVRLYFQASFIESFPGNSLVELYFFFMFKITCHFVPGKVPVQLPKMYTCERDAHNVHCDPEYVEHIVPNGAVDHGTGVHMSCCIS